MEKYIVDEQNGLEYSDRSNFFKAFRTYYGMTPRVFRPSRRNPLKIGIRQITGVSEYFPRGLWELPYERIMRLKCQQNSMLANLQQSILLLQRLSDEKTIGRR